MSKPQWVTRAVCLGCALGFVLSIATIAPPALAAKADNSVRFTHPSTLDSADPYFSNSRITIIVADSVWDTLIFRNPATGEFEASLATAWRWLDDVTLELDLRRGVRFHNGAEFVADDVVYTLEYVSDPKNAALKRNEVSWIDRAERVDAHRVRIIAKQPFAAALAVLATPGTAIYPHEYYARVGPAGMSARPVGTGPFRVTEHVPGKHIRLARNPDYYAGGPKGRAAIDTVEVRSIPDAQTRIAEVLTGGIDLVMSVARDQAEQLREIPSLRIVSGDSIRYSYLAMNTQASTAALPLRDVRVRQAIAHAIDRDALVTHLIGNSARVLHSPCHPAQFGCEDTGVRRYDYDPPAARRLLVEAGWANGFAIDLYASNGNRNVTEAIVNYLGNVGIRARLRALEAVVVGDALRRGRAALAHTTWGSSSIMDIAAGVSNFYELSADDVNRDTEVRDLLVRGDTTLDPAARKSAYGQALELIAERVYTVPLYSVPVYYVANEDLVFTPHTDEIPRFWEMSWR
jgi:peptide/nickel transport system substrate-binding protein